MRREPLNVRIPRRVVADKNGCWIRSALQALTEPAMTTRWRGTIAEVDALHSELSLARHDLAAALAELAALRERIGTSEQLHDVLMAMNESGTEPVVIGFDANDKPFLAYGWAPGGDGWDAGFVHDDTHSAEFDYSDGTLRCEECGAFDRRAVEKLAYPVRLIRAALAGPAPTEATVEIGGQVMTEAQFNAARFPLLSHLPSDITPEKRRPSPGPAIGHHRPLPTKEN